jgi:hypothetical protein
MSEVREEIGSTVSADDGCGDEKSKIKENQTKSPNP